MKTKKCTCCNNNKDVSLFGKNGNSLRSTCKECTNKIVVEAQKKTREYIRTFKKECAVCKYSKCIEALDFHHIDENKKEFNLGKSRSWSDSMKESIDREISKCVVLCANCHREYHFYENEGLVSNFSEFLNKKC